MPIPRVKALPVLVGREECAASLDAAEESSVAAKPGKASKATPEPAIALLLMKSRREVGNAPPSKLQAAAFVVGDSRRSISAFRNRKFYALFRHHN
jgi:hypothetical protein